MNVQSILTVALIGLTSACGGIRDGSGDGLEPEDVDDLGTGDAVGSEATGTYDLEVITTECRGECPVLRVGAGRVSLCDVGNVDYPGIDVTQTDGRVDIVTFGMFPDRLAGSIDADGAFVIGGWGTNFGARVILLVEGSVAGDELIGTAESRSHGRFEGQSFDCTSMIDVAGVRIR